MSKPHFLLNDHYAVVFRATCRPERELKVLNKQAWHNLQQLANDGHFVILESWLITEGRCVSN
jgi:hypothetical protein